MKSHENEGRYAIVADVQNDTLNIHLPLPYLVLTAETFVDFPRSTIELADLLLHCGGGRKQNVCYIIKVVV